MKASIPEHDAPRSTDMNLQISTQSEWQQHTVLPVLLELAAFVLPSLSLPHPSQSWHQSSCDYRGECQHLQAARVHGACA